MSTAREYPIDPLATRRLEICKLCKLYSELNSRCTVCGCAVNSLINNEKASCPVGKW